MVQDNRQYKEKLVKKNEASRLLGIARTTLDRYEAEGKIKSTKNEFGRTRYDYATLLEFARESLPPIFAETTLYTDYQTQIIVKGNGQLVLQNQSSLTKANWNG